MIKIEDTLNSNTNLIEDNKDNFMDIDIISIKSDDDGIISVDSDSDDDKNGIISLGNNKINKTTSLIDLDQNDQQKIKIEIDDGNDGDIDFSIKREETEQGFLPEIPNKDNLGQQIIKIEDDDDITEFKKEEDPEMDTNFERSVAVLPTSHSLNILGKRKKQEEQYENKAKKSKVNNYISLEEFKANVDKYLKKTRQIDIRKLDFNFGTSSAKKSKILKPNSINLEEFGPNLEKYFKKNRRIDIHKLKKEQPKKNNRTTNSSSSLSKAIVPADYFRNISRTTNNDDYIFNSNTGNVRFLRQKRRAIKPKKDIDTNIVLPTSHSLNLNRQKR